MALTLDLTGQRVLVIGASAGVGRAVAQLAASSGARVALAARRRERLEEAAKGIAASGGEAHPLPCDVTREADCRDAVAQAVSLLGGLDALVYAPGISPLRMLQEATQQEWHEVLDVNLIGASLIAAAAVSHLEESGGRAVFVGSYAVRQTLPGISLYSVSKVALDGLLVAWRMEHPDVDFTRVVLGNTGGTEFADGWGPERTAAAVKIWIERGLFAAPNMMSLEAAAEAITSVLAIQGYVDDIAIMPRTRDPSAGS